MRLVGNRGIQRIRATWLLPLMLHRERSNVQTSRYEGRSETFGPDLVFSRTKISKEIEPDEFSHSESNL